MVIIGTLAYSMAELELDQHLLDFLNLSVAVIELILRLSSVARPVPPGTLLHHGRWQRWYSTLLHSLLMLIELLLNGVSLHVHLSFLLFINRFLQKQKLIEPNSPFSQILLI